MTQIITPILKMVLSQHFESSKIKIDKIELLRGILDFNSSRPNNKQRFIVEQTFQTIYGKHIPYNHIKILLEYASPSEAIRLYRKSYSYVTTSESKKQFILKNEFKLFSFKEIKVYKKTLTDSLWYFFSCMAAYILSIPAVYVAMENSWFKDVFWFKGWLLFMLSFSISTPFLLIAAFILFNNGNFKHAITLTQRS